MIVRKTYADKISDFWQHLRFSECASAIDEAKSLCPELAPWLDDARAMNARLLHLYNSLTESNLTFSGSSFGKNSACTVTSIRGGNISFYDKEDNSVHSMHWKLLSPNDVWRIVSVKQDPVLGNEKEVTGAFEILRGNFGPAYEAFSSNKAAAEIIDLYTDAFADRILAQAAAKGKVDMLCAEFRRKCRGAGSFNSANERIKAVSDKKD